MSNEIELKIMLKEKNIPFIQNWLNQQQLISSDTLQLGNTYFDTPDLFFAKNKMGLRIRTQNNTHELTLKMKGQIVGGLHIRPEYNLALNENKPDFKRLVFENNLQIENPDAISENLTPTFSTDFTRQTWLIAFQNAQIEIALDRGEIKNPFGSEQICEIEFELKQGEINDLFALIETLPLRDGMWLSSLSKAQRGYFVGQPEKIAKEIEKLTACNLMNCNEMEKYQCSQQIADFLRLMPNNTVLTQQFLQLENLKKIYIQSYLISPDYLKINIQRLKSLC